MDAFNFDDRRLCSKEAAFSSSLERLHAMPSETGCSVQPQPDGLATTAADTKTAVKEEVSLSVICRLLEYYKCRLAIMLHDKKQLKLLNRCGYYS